MKRRVWDVRARMELEAKLELGCYECAQGWGRGGHILTMPYIKPAAFNHGIT